ncbi:MAG: hypothetical protein QOE97_327 [Pseudonocardiales bacterium]|nr:hypothetical protein [Pseudonocardiales bacterium]
MSTRTRERLGLGLILLAVLGIEALGLRSGTVGVALLIALAVIAGVIFAVRVDLKWAGMGAAVLAAFTLTWNGWFVGPVRPGDALIPIALICFVLADPNHSLRWPPWWVKQLGFVVLLVAAIHIFLPADDLYLSGRTVLTATGKPTVSTKGSLASANLGVGIKFIIATVFLAVTFAAAARVDRRAVKWLTVAFAAGSSLSGVAAFAAKLGFGQLTRLVLRGGRGCSATLGGLCQSANDGGRQLGFSNHPNFLAAGLCLGVPLAVWLMAKRDRTGKELLLGVLLMPGLILGTYASGSRGGAVCVVGAVALSVLLFARTRQYLPGFALGGAIVVGAIIAFVPGFGAKILQVTRLSGSAATAGSDTVRSLVGAQGVRDFQHSPIQGVGLQVSFEASQVYLQELASGGLLLFTAMSIYMLGGMLESWGLMRKGDELAGAILGCLVIILALNIFEADLTDRFYYVPVAILVAHLLTLERGEGSEPAEGAAAEEPVAIDVAPAISRR